MSPSSWVAPQIRFRRRLTVAFVVVVGIAAGLLAIGCYLTVAHQRHILFERRNIAQTRLALSLTNGEESASRVDSLIKAARERNGFETLVVSDSVVSSNPRITESYIPLRLRNAEGHSTDEVQTANARVDGIRYMVVASEIPGSQRARLYLWFNEQTVSLSLADLRNVLFSGWFMVTGLSFFAGRLIAIRTLAPIQLAADSARLRAEGLLHTTFPARESDEFRAWSDYFDNIAVALEDKLAELQAAHERERRFTADVAHDLRTPLGAMVSASSILCEYIDEMPEGARRPAELLVNDVKRLRHLVTDILEMGRLDASSEPPHVDPIDVGELINGVVRTEPVEVTITGEPRIQSDRVRLERILSNLVTNALVHGKEEITLTANATTDRFVVDICDRGPGIPEDQLPYIFDRFHKAEASRSGEGSGLGLAIALQHAQILGGTITASNREGGGACFHLDIPAGTISEGEDPAPECNPAPEKGH